MIYSLWEISCLDDVHPFAYGKEERLIYQFANKRRNYDTLADLEFRDMLVKDFSSYGNVFNEFFNRVEKEVVLLENEIPDLRKYQKLGTIFLKGNEMIKKSPIDQVDLIKEDVLDFSAYLIDDVTANFRARTGKKRLVEFLESTRRERENWNSEKG